MAAFAYSAINALGIESSGQLTAADLHQAREQLRQRGLRPVALTEVTLEGGSVYGFRRWKRTPAGRQVWDRFKLRVPAGIGKVVLKVTMARFSRTLATLVGAGVDIIKALEIAGNTSGNWVVESALGEVRAKVHQGVPIAQPLVETPVFPPLVSQMVKVGEETGELEKMLDKIADFYEDEVDTSIASLTSIIEPLM